MLSSEAGNRIKKVGLVLAVAGMLLFTACSKDARKTGAEETDILSQKQTEDGRTRISVLVKYAFTINNFEEMVEKKFPDIDIVQVGNYTSNMGIDEYARRLEHDDLTDIVMTWPLDVGEEYWNDRLLDLSGLEFTDRYKISELNRIARDGELYYLPGPAQVRGIIYNKTLFEEKGWQVPADYEGFIQLCKTIEESGIRSLQLGFKNPEVLDTAFIGYNYGSCFSKPEDLQWIDEFNKGAGSFGDHFGKALDVFQNMIDEGVWKESDLEVDYPKREYMLFNRECAMIEDSVLMAGMGYDMVGSTDEFALMPFFNPGNDGDWARIYMVCYIGANKHLAEDANKEKYDKVMKLLDYISTPEGQNALSSDTGGMFSSLNNVAPSDAPEIVDLIPALSEGRYAIFMELANAQVALRKGLEGMLRGEVTKEEVIESIDQQNTAIETVKTVEKLGTAKSDFTLSETGGYVTDEMRDWAKTDVALFLDNGMDGRYNGKGIRGKIYKGDVTDVDIDCILPGGKRGETKTLWKVSMTGEDLINALEYAIVVDNEKDGWFYYYSGLKMEFDPLAKPGSRIKKIELEDGKEIEKAKTYTVAVMDNTVSEEYVKECEKTDKLIADILKEAMQKEGEITPPKDGRFVIAK